MTIYPYLPEEADYTFEVAGYPVGFRDVTYYDGDSVTYAELGPITVFHAPFSAKACWAIVIVFPILLVLIPALLCRIVRFQRATRFIG